MWSSIDFIVSSLILCFGGCVSRLSSGENISPTFEFWNRFTTSLLDIPSVFKKNKRQTLALCPCSSFKMYLMLIDLSVCFRGPFLLTGSILLFIQLARSYEQLPAHYCLLISSLLSSFSDGMQFILNSQDGRTFRFTAARFAERFKPLLLAGVVYGEGVAGGAGGVTAAVVFFRINSKVYGAYGVVVSMFDFHRSDRGSNPGRGGQIS